MRQRGVQIGPSFKVPSYLMHPLVVPSIRFQCILQSLTSLSRWGDAPSLCSVAGGCSLALLSHWRDAPSLCSVAGGMLPCFAQSLGRMLPHFTQLWGGCSLLCSVAGGMLPHFAQSLGECFLTLLSCWGDAPSICSVAEGCSLALLSHWRDAPSLCSVTFHSMVPSNCSKICILEGQ